MPSRSTSQSLNALPLGTVLHDYVIESELGSGGFSMVYLARHRLTSDWLHAIKEYFPRELAARDNDGGTVRPVNVQAEKAFEDGLRRFRDEAEQLRTFRNEPYIVSCQNYFEQNGTAYLVMDYDDGLPLSEFIERREAAGQPFTGTDLLAVVEPLLEGLAVVHRAGVLHRDIKPGNIFVRRPDDITGRPAQPVLMDFGAAKQNYLEQHSRSRAPYTPGYAAYEQISSEGDIGPWTDIYAIGALMWRMVAGGRPGDSRLLITDESGGERTWSPTPRAAEKRAYALHRGRPDPMVPATELGAGRFSPNVLKVIDSCLSLYPEGRPQHCGDLRALLNASVRPISSSTDIHSERVIADVFEAAERAHDQGEYEIALREYRKLAELGHAEAQYRLGEIHYYGKGVAKDDSLAFQWFTRAAEHGCVGAQVRLGVHYLASEDHVQAVKWLTCAAEHGRADVQFRLGKMYKTGDGVPQDWSESVKWFTFAAEQGDAEAQYQLGRMFRDGDDGPGVRILSRVLNDEGVSEDESRSVEWYTRAAGQGHASAQDELGLMYEIGVGVSQDHAQAVEWYARAADQGHANAQYHLGEMYSSGRGVPKDEALAATWYTRAAEQGHADAQCELGVMNYFGKGVPEDRTRSVHWFALAAEQGEKAPPVAQRYRAAVRGDAKAQWKLGSMYHWDDPGAPKDHAQAVHWYSLAAAQGHDAARRYMAEVQAVERYKHAAEQGDAEAQYELGSRYEIGGDGTPQDPAHAAHWYTRAAENGHEDARLKLGEMYTTGLGVAEDYRQAVQWYTRAAEQGNAVAQFKLGDMYRNGEGVPEDPMQAIEWFIRAAEQGEPNAQFSLGSMYKSGTGVQASNVHAYAWTNLAVGHLHRISLCGKAPESVRRLNDPAANLRDEIAADLSDTQLAEAQQLSIELDTHIQNSR